MLHKERDMASVNFWLLVCAFSIWAKCIEEVSAASGRTSASSSSPSPLRAFKQLGFDDVGGPKRFNTYSSSSSYGAYGSVKSHSASSSTTTHPNDILSNMGVELPAQQILGESFSRLLNILIASLQRQIATSF